MKERNEKIFNMLYNMRYTKNEINQEFKKYQEASKNAAMAMINTNGVSKKLIRAHDSRMRIYSNAVTQLEKAGILQRVYKHEPRGKKVCVNWGFNIVIDGAIQDIGMIAIKNKKMSDTIWIFVNQEILTFLSNPAIYLCMRHNDYRVDAHVDNIKYSLERIILNSMSNEGFDFKNCPNEEIHHENLKCIACYECLTRMSKQQHNDYHRRTGYHSHNYSMLISSQEDFIDVYNKIDNIRKACGKNKEYGLNP